jgi:membrane associated rhomboid family serine protease
MTSTGIITFFLIAANFAFSYKGFKNHAFLDSYKFQVDPILVNKEYKRLITSGFLHVSWTHLIFNMISLLFFSGVVELYLGGIQFLVIYFSSMIGGGLLCLFVHRNHGEYSAVGASGAVCGVIFAAIALFPGLEISFFFLPIPIKGWIFGLVYVLYSIYGIRSNRDNIGHDAHLGGAMIGMIVALLMRPEAIGENYFTILIIAVPAIAFIVLIVARPHVLLIDNLFYKAHRNYYSVDHRVNVEKVNKQAEIDRILDKIHRSGISSLSKKEKEALDQYSKSQR